MYESVQHLLSPHMQQRADELYICQAAGQMSQAALGPFPALVLTTVCGLGRHLKREEMKRNEKKNRVADVLAAVGVCVPVLRLWSSQTICTCDNKLGRDRPCVSD